MKDIVFEAGDYYVYRSPAVGVYKVFKNGPTAAKLMFTANFKRDPAYALARAVAYVENAVYQQTNED